MTSLHKIIERAELVRKENIPDSITPERIGSIISEALQQIDKDMMTLSAACASHVLDLTDIGDGSYINIGERGFTQELIDDLQKDAPKNFTLHIKQGLNTAQCPYGGFFLPEGQEGGNVYLISQNYQQPQFIRLWQGKSKIQVFIKDILTEADFKYTTPVEIDELLKTLK